jgi:hypothetical protein
MELMEDRWKAMNTMRADTVMMLAHLMDATSEPQERSTSAQDAPALAAVTASTEGQAPILFASGWEAPKPSR